MYVRAAAREENLITDGGWAWTNPASRQSTLERSQNGADQLRARKESSLPGSNQATQARRRSAHRSNWVRRSPTAGGELAVPPFSAPYSTARGVLRAQGHSVAISSRYVLNKTRSPIHI
jgi:hypothetical protein